MNSLDSRYLRLGDTFAHRFTHSGRYVYAVGAPGGIAPPGHHTGFEIVVEAEKGAASQTHYVTVAWANGAFSVEPANLHIKNNDVILVVDRLGRDARVRGAGRVWARSFRQRRNAGQ